jgi:hypothetical protein
MDPDCNKSVGAHCTDAINKEICYKDVVIKIDDVVEPSTPADPKKPLDTDWIKYCWTMTNTRKQKLLDAITKYDSGDPLTDDEKKAKGLFESMLAACINSATGKPYTKEEWIKENEVKAEPKTP